MGSSNPKKDKTIEKIQGNVTVSEKVIKRYDSEDTYVTLS